MYAMSSALAVFTDPNNKIDIELHSAKLPVIFLNAGKSFSWFGGDHRQNGAARCQFR